MFLDEPPASVDRDELYEVERADEGYVGNLTRLWAWRPDVMNAFAQARAVLQQSWSLTDTDRAVLVAATAQARRDSYCALAWGTVLAELVGVELARDVLSGRMDGLPSRHRALARWAAGVVTDPNALTAADVDDLRQAGLDDRAIFEATAFVAFRLAFSTVNDALAAEPDAQLAATAPAPVRKAVSYGRRPSSSPSA